jgi:hypothetical protein
MQTSIRAGPKTIADAKQWTVQRLLSFPAALAVLVVVTVFAAARKGLADPDIWWHLRNAENLLHRFSWPRADAYSYTAFGNRWMNYEWLAEIPYYLAWRAFGLVGIKALSLLLLEIIFCGLFYCCHRKSGNIKAAAVATYLAILLGSVSFGPRTILFGYMYLVALLLLLENYRAGSSARLWMLPILFCVWINTHGSWALGLVVFAIFFSGGLVQGRWGNIEAVLWSARQLRQLGAVMLASIAALFLNPYGYRLVFYPLDMAFNQRLNIAHIAEWSSVDFHDVRGKIALTLLIVLLLASLLSRGCWQLYELALVLFGLYCGLTYIRFLFLAGILGAPIIAKLLKFIPQYQPELLKIT